MSKLSYSFSDFSTAVQCLRKHKLIKIDQLKPDVPESADLNFGTAMHGAVQAELEGEDGEKVFDAYWNTLIDKELQTSRFDHEQLGLMGPVFVSKFRKFYKDKFKPKEMEKRLYSEYKGIKLEGTPDMVGYYEGELGVWDWKTAAYAYDKAKAQISVQLFLYAYLVMMNYPELDIKHVGYLVFDKSGPSIQRPIILPFEKNKMIAMMDDLVDYLKIVDAAEVFPKNHNSCIMGKAKCPFFNTCHGSSPVC